MELGTLVTEALVKLLFWIRVLTLGASIAVTCPAVASECALPGVPRTLLASGSKRLEYWETQARTFKWDAPGIVPATLRAFRETIVGAGINPTPTDLVIRKLILGQVDLGNERNLRLSIKNSKAIRKMNCLETLLFARQAARKDMASQPTEFVAFVLESDDRERIRIYNFTVDQAGIGNLGIPLAAIRRDVAAKWRLRFNTHNHNFFLGQPDINGVLAPSVQDVLIVKSLMGELGMHAVSVTNGFDTLAIDGEDMFLYSDH